MKQAFIAGFGPIVRDTATSRAFWGDGLGIKLEESWETISHLLSPEGIHVGIAFTAWMHEKQ